MLFHVSDEPDIRIFEPRSSVYIEDPVVWAIDLDRLPNYLLPRDCPRVTYYAGAATTAVDIERFLGSSRAVIAVESDWFERIRSTRLYCYHLPTETFTLHDDCAGYHISASAVTPVHVDVFDDVIGEILKRNIEMRFLPNLWKLCDEVAKSSLQFSNIRMRNAQPRP